VVERLLTFCISLTLVLCAVAIFPRVSPDFTV
jgi:hypothetical protein